MNFDNLNQDLNYSHYEEDLSPYGRNVLQILMRRWNKDREQRYENVITNQQRHQHYQRPTFRKDRVLTFEDANITLAPKPLSPPPCVNDDIDDDSPFHFNDDPEPPPLTAKVVPTTVQLLNSSNVGVKDNLLGSRPLQHEPDSTNEQIAVSPYVLHESPMWPQHPVNPKAPVSLQHPVRSKPPLRQQSPVTTPLLQPHCTNTIYPSTSTSLLNTVEKNNCEEHTEHQSPEPCKPVQKPRKPRQEIKKKPKIVEDSKAPKRKVQTKVTDTVPKKVKKVESYSKNPFRQEKYTKSVKDWLKDVDPALPVEEEAGGEVGGGGAEHRIVQARLTNIGGTMKFAKPATDPKLTHNPHATPAQIDKRVVDKEVNNKPRNALKELNNKPRDYVIDVNNKPRDAVKEVNNKPRDTLKEVNKKPINAMQEVNKKAREIEKGSNHELADGVKKVINKPTDALKEVNKKPINAMKEVNKKADGIKEVINKARDAMKESNNKPRDVVIEKNNKVKVKKSNPRFVVPLKSQSTQQTNQSMPGTSQETTCQPSVSSQLPACIKSPDVAACAELGTGSELVVMRIPGGGGEYTKGVLVLHGDCAYSVDSAIGVQGEFLLHILRECTMVCYDGKRLLRYFMDLLHLELDCMDLSVRDVKVAGNLVWADSPPATLEALLRASKSVGGTEKNMEGLQKNVGGSEQKSGSSEHAGGWEPMKRALQIRAVSKALFDKLRADGMWTLFVDIEMNVLPIIAAMEHRGLPINEPLVEQLELALQSASTRCEQAAHACAGRALPLHAPAALRKCLYDELQLDRRANIKVNHTPANRDKSTSEEMLRALSGVHPLPGLIIHYRRLHKARVTYVAAMKAHTKNGVLYPTWLQCAAATGRIGCANPNVQALPAQPVSLACPDFKGDNLPTDDNTVQSPPTDDAGSDADEEMIVEMMDDDSLHGDHADNSTESANIRAVIRARPGYSLVACDYRHTECRLLARASGDKALHAALHAPDIFLELAAHWLDKPVSAITSHDRALSKRALYAVSYGCGAAKLRHLTAARSDAAARQMLHTFNTKFPGLRAFVSSVCARAASSGGMLRLGSGRRRQLQASARGSGALTPRAQRQAVNFMIQGAAADLCKLAMVRTQRAIRGMDARLLLTVHDELVWEVESSIVGTFASRVRAVMEACGGAADVAGGGGRLPVSVRAGPHWGHMTLL